MKLNIPIIVVAYNRPDSLMRLLYSLGSAVYQNKTKLIISIDKSDDKSIGEIAEGFEWKHGEKEIIRHKKHLGLRDHILSAGDLSLEADGVIILEDDLYVSPFFYDYSVKAFEYYQSEKNIAGVSLYAHNYNETARLPFTPMLDDSDVFFMQIPSSWGQCWSKKQWSEFKSWLEKNKDKEPDSITGLPNNALSWPNSSWKKYFFWYMINKNKFFAYPRYSLSSNFGDPGTHYKGKELFLQTPLITSKRKFVFKKPKDSFATYDAFCELLPDKLVNLQPTLKKFDFTTDLYGTKPLNQIKTPYVLTSKSCNSAIFSFARELKPHEANVINKVDGKDLFLAKKNECIENKTIDSITDAKLYYFFNIRNFQIEPYARLEEKVKSLIDQQNKLIDSIKEKDQLIGLKDKVLAEKDEMIHKFNQYAVMAEKLANEKEVHVKDHKKSIEQHEKLLEQSRAEIKLLSENLKEKDVSLEKRSNELEKRKQDIAAKLIQIEKQNEKTEHLAKEVESLKLTLKNRESETKQLKSLIEEKELRANKKDSEIASLQLSLKERESHVEKLESIITGQKKEFEVKTTLSEKLQNQLSELQNKLQNNEDMIVRLREDIKILNHKIKTANEKENEQNNAIREHKNQINELKEFIREIEKSYTFRVGKAIIWPASKLKQAMLRQ